MIVIRVEMSLGPIAQGCCPSDCFLNEMGNHDAVHRTIQNSCISCQGAYPYF